MGLEAGHDADFLIEEWEEVVDAWGVWNAGGYARVPRFDRKLRLGARQREGSLGRVRPGARAAGGAGAHDPGRGLCAPDAPGGGGVGAALHALGCRRRARPDGRAGALPVGAGAGRPDALFFTGDLGQRIFRLPFSWAKLGLDVRGRAEVLRVCYRASHRIRDLADRLLAPEIVDQDGLVEQRMGTVSLFDGPEPEAVGARLAARIAEGFAPEEPAVLVRGPAQLARGRAAVRAGRATVPVLPMPDAKGPEFRGVATMALDEDVLPDAERLVGVSYRRSGGGSGYRAAPALCSIETRA